VKRVIKLFLQRDFDRLEALTADNAFVYVQAPPKLPYAGRYEGKSCVRNFVEKFNESFQILSVPEVYYYINESGSVFVGLDFELKTILEPAQILKTSVAMKVKVDDELMLNKMAVISDTLAVYAVLEDVGAVTSDSFSDEGDDV
jgi:hypothetical protein